jgi:hypothetical protein
VTKQSAEWWVIHGDVLRDVLRRAAAGEDPELLFVELVANSRSEDVE